MLNAGEVASARLNLLGSWWAEPKVSDALFVAEINPILYI
jgi:hypothetical protein